MLVLNSQVTLPAVAAVPIGVASTTRDEYDAHELSVIECHALISTDKAGAGLTVNSNFITPPCCVNGGLPP